MQLIVEILIFVEVLKLKVISLVEEKVLQLIDIGVYQIDEIAQILGLKRNHFKYRRINQQGYEGEILEEKSGLYDELKKIHFTKNKKGIDYTLITDEVFNDRKLMDGEYRDILKYIVSQSSDVDLYVDNLDDWAY